MANVTRESKTVLTAEDRTGSAFASMQKSVASAQASIMSMHGALTGLVSGGVIGGFALMVKHAIDAADEMGKMAQKTGIATAELSKLTYVAKLSDVSNESLVKGIKGLSDWMVKAADATSNQARVLKALGVDAGGSVTDALSSLANVFKNLPDGATKTTLAVQLFGKAGQELIPMLNQGSAGIEKLKDEAEKLGLVIREDTAKAAEAFNDNLKALETSSTSLARSFVSGTVEALAKVTEAMKSALIQGNKLYALWIGFGGLASNLFTDFDLSPLEKAQKQLAELEQQVVQQRQRQKDAEGLVGPGGDAIRAAIAGGLKIANEQIALLRSQISAINSQGDLKKLNDDLDDIFMGADKGANEKKVRDLLGIKDTSADAAKELERLANVFNDVMGKSDGLAGDYNDKLSSLYKYFSLGKISLDQYRDVVGKLIQQQPYLIKLAKDQAEAFDKEFEAQEKLRLATEDSIKSGRLLTEGMEFELSTLGMTNTQRQIAVALRQLENAGIKQGSKAYEEFVPRIRAVIEEMENQKAMIGMWDSLSSAAGNFFSDLVLHGKSAFDSLKQSLKSFAADLLSFFAKRWVLNMVAGAGLGGLSTAASAASTAMGGTAIGTGLGALFGTAGTASAPGAMAWAGGAWGGADAAATTGLLGNGGLMASMASNPVGWIAAAAVAAFALFGQKGGGAKVGGSFQTSGATNNLFGLTAGESTGNAAVKAIAEATAKSYAQMVGMFGGANRGFNFGLAYDSDPRGTAQNRIIGQVRDASGNLVFNEHDREIGRDGERIGPELQLTASRALLAALQASNLQADMAKLFGSVAAATADQPTLDALFASANDLQTVLAALGTVTIPGLTVDGLKAMQTQGESLAQTLGRVADAFYGASNDILAAADKISGGALGKVLRENEANSAASAWNSIWGGSESVSDTIANVIRYSGNLPVLQSMMDAAFAKGGQPALDALARLFNAVGANTEATNMNTGAVENVANYYYPGGGASSLPGQYYSNTGGPGSGTDWSGLVSYLNGTGVSDLSPLTLEAKYNQSKASLQSMIALAQGGDLDAISGLGGARDSFLGFSRQRFASSGQYNTDFFSTFDQLNTLTSNAATRPTTASDTQAQTAALVAEQKVSQGKVDVLTQAVAAMTNAIVENARENTAETKAELADAAASLRKIANSGGVLTGSF